MLRWFVFVFLTVAGVLCPVPVYAQACCAAASAVSPGRLALHERALLGFQTGVGLGFGSFDAEGHFHTNEQGSSSWDARLTAFGTLAVASRFQVGVTLPVVAAFRESRTSGSEVGASFGDISLNLRYDMLLNGEHRWLPGVAWIANATFPTGRAAESSETVLGSDVSGQGAWQLGAGLWLERSFGEWLVTAAGIVNYRFPRTIAGLESELAPEVSLLGALGYAASTQLGLMASLLVAVEGDARVNGQLAGATERRQIRVTLGSAYNITETLRILGSISLDPPFDGWGANQFASVGGSFTASWSFL